MLLEPITISTNKVGLCKGEAEPSCRHKEAIDGESEEAASVPKGPPVRQQLEAAGVCDATLSSFPRFTAKLLALRQRWTLSHLVRVLAVANQLSKSRIAIWSKMCCGAQRLDTLSEQPHFA